MGLMGLKEISYNISETESSALPSFTRTLENLEEAVSCISGIDTSGLGLNLNTDQIKADIETIISEIHTIVTNVKSILDELVRVEQENAEIIKYYLGEEDITEFYKKISEIFETVEPQEIWNEDIERELIDYYGEFKISRPKNDDGTPKPIIICKLNDGESFVQGLDSLFDGFNGYVIFLHSSDLEEEAFDSIINTCQEDVDLNCNIDLNRKVELKESKVRDLKKDKLEEMVTTAITSDDDSILPKPILGDTQYYYDYESMGFLVDKVYLNENGEVVYIQKVPVNTRLYQKEGDRYMCGGNAVLSWRVALGGKIGGEDGDAYQTENGNDIDPKFYSKEDGEFPTPEGIDPVFYKIYDTRLADGGRNGGQRQFLEFSGADVVAVIRNDNNDRGDDIWDYLGLGDLAIGKWNRYSLFTDGGHYMTLGGLMENDKAILYDSALPWNTELDVAKGQVHGTIEVTKELEERYAEGFTKEEVTTGLVSTFIVKPEFRTEYLRVDGQTNKNSFVITEEGQLMQIDFSELPECVDTNFNGVVIHESGINKRDDEKGWFYYELEDPNNPHSVSNLVQTAACPVQYPSKPAKTLAEAVNDGDITLDEALSSIEYAVENGNISNEKAQELIDGLPKS